MTKDAKMTKKNYFEALVNFANTGVLTISTDELRAFAEKEVALLEKKAAKAKETAAKKKAVMDELTEHVEDVLMDAQSWMTIAEVTNVLVEGGVDTTTAKVQYRLNTLVKNGLVVKEEATIKEEGKKARKAMTYKWNAETSDTVEVELESDEAFE